MHECVCGHGPELHDDLKRCGGECFDGEYGLFACVCPIYQHEEDQ